MGLRLDPKRTYISMIDGFVLIGGKSSRMGCPKEQLEVGGQKLFARAVAALRSACSDPITLVGNTASDLDPHSASIRDVRIQAMDHVRAPIIGLYSALIHAKTSWIGILACDLPFVTGDLVTKLAGYCSNEFDAVVPVQPDTRAQPLCAFYRRESCLPEVHSMIDKGDLKIQELLTHVRTRFVQFNEIADLKGSAKFFINVNDATDYATAVAKVLA